MLLDPIVHEYDLVCTPEHAFDVYTCRIGQWWHPDYSADPATLQTVTIEAGVGGRVVATYGAEDEHTWGEVTAWDPGRRLEHTFTLAQPAGHPSTVTVRFEPSPSGSRMHFAHGGWDEDNAAVRGKFSDWSVILDRFSALAGQVTHA